MSINIGTVYATVAPDAREFNSLLRAQVGPAGDAAGKQISDALSRGIRDGLSDPAAIAPADRQGARAGDAFGGAFQKRVRAALSALPSAEVQLEDEAAQAKLDFLREELTSLSSKTIGVDISDTDAIARLTALRAEMDNLAARSASVQVNVDTAAAAAQLDRFFAETTIKAEATGNEVGDKLTSSAAGAATRGSPLIMAAVTGGLLAGGPAVLAASTLLFAGIAAGVAAQDPTVRAAFGTLMTDVKDTIRADAADIAPAFTEIAAHASQAFRQIAPEIHTALVAIAPDVLSITDALEAAAETAFPAFVRVVQNAGPIVSGLDSVIRSIGTGVAGFLDAVDAHAGAAGTVLSALGNIIGGLLPTLGNLIGEGAELGSVILPPIASALHLVEGALNAVAPVLPPVVAGFIALKATQGVENLLGSAANGLLKISASLPEGLGARIAGIGTSLGGVAKAEGEAAGGAALLGPVGLAVAGIAAAFTFLSQETAKAKAAQDAATASLVRLMQAQAQGGAAGDAAAVKLTNYKNTIADLQSKLDATQTSTVNGAKGMDQYGGSVTAQGSKIDLLKKQLADATGEYSRQQAVLAPLNSTAQVAAQMNDSVSNALKAVQSSASQANTQIDLLKTAMDQLTGKTTTADQAQIAVTQAIQSATTATQGQTGALIDVNGQINLNSAAGASAAQSLINLASTQHNEIAVLEQQGASSDVVKQKSNDLRNQFIATAQQMGFTAGQAQALADKYYGIPGQVNTEINADTSPASRAIDSLLKGYAAVSYNGTNITVGAGLTRIIANAEGNVLPMSATSASIVQPGTLRVIGDNPTADEAFIPINNSPRSLSILGETAARMGLGLAPMANGGIMTDQGTVIAHAGQALLDQIGAKAKAARDAYVPPSPAGGATIGGLTSAGGNAGNRALGVQIANSMGVGNQFSSIDYIFSHESGWNNLAQNPTSTAYGIPQFLNSTWATVGGHKTSDPSLQIQYGIKYMSKYGGPAGAAAFWAAHHWYDQGGEVPEGSSLLYNGTGDTELIAPKQTFREIMDRQGGSQLEGLEISGTLDLGDGLKGRIDGRIVHARERGELAAAAGTSFVIY